MACRYVLSSQYRPDVSPTERTHKVIAIVNKMVSMMEGVIQVSASTPGRAASVRVLLVRMCERSQSALSPFAYVFDFERLFWNESC